VPKRLIDVGLPEQPFIKLVQTDGRPLDYVALSYCWGENQTGRITTRETVSEMMQGVSLTLLSQTILDAVTVVRRLRLRYLWVDALCIIQGQDNTGDWADELQKMGQIYNNAYLTIAATSASAASEGFLNHRNRGGIPIDFRARKSDQCEGIIFFRESITVDHSFTEDVHGSPLLKRAWVKQERVLSRRTIDFSSNQIFWTCRLTRYSEDGQQHSDDGIESAALIHCLRTFHLSMGMARKQKDMFQGLFFRAWSDLVQEYSTLQLKYESDRLPALAGIADIASRIISDQYLSGIWKANLSSGLLWNPTKYPVKLSGVAGVPSWSWASVIG
ncbi:heterokaryon incompatibility protein-domain-containing protein, partial [Dactylonectria macrodidyma]